MADPVAATESSPLLTGPEAVLSEPRPKATRTVTFNPNPVSQTFEAEPELRRPRTSHLAAGAGSSSGAGSSGATGSAISTGSLAAGTPMLSAINNKLRRRNSHGSVPQTTLPPALAPKIGPQRSTKNAQKLKILPNPEFGEEGPDEESGRDVYSQYTRIKDPTARRDAARLGKADREKLPRVTAFCTANKYETPNLMRFLKGRGKTRGANPKLIDECIYTPYSYSSKQAESGREEQVQEIQSRPAQIHERRHSDGEIGGSDYQRDSLIDLGPDGRGHDIGNGYHPETVDHQADLLRRVIGDDSALSERPADFDINVHTPEVFLFDYGVVVIWGMSVAHEQRFLKEIAKFETEKLAVDDVETEYFNFYYTKEYQPRIYNDFIALRDKNNYMTKLAISHALAQSVKVRESPFPPFLRQAY